MQKLFSGSAQTVALWIVLALAVLIPVIVLPITEQFLVYSKFLVLVLGTLAILAAFGWHIWTRKTITLVASPLTLPVLLIGVAALLSSFVSGNYPVEHLFGMGGVLISATILVLFGSSLLSDDEDLASYLLSALSLSSVLLTMSSALQLFGMGPTRVISMLTGLTLPDTLAFNISGSSVIALEVLAIALVGLIARVVTGYRLTILQQIGILATFIGIALHGWSVLPGQIASPALLPMTASYSVAIDTLRQPKTALIGVGPEAFENAYNQFKPNWMNGSEYWAIQFTQASNTPFSLLITSGIIGLIGWAWLAVVAVRLLKDSDGKHKSLHLMLLTTLVLQLVLPPNFVLVALQAVILTVLIAAAQDRFSIIEIFGVTVRVLKKRTQDHRVSHNALGVVYTVLALLGIVIGGSSYGLFRAFAAEWAFLQSARAAVNNDAVGVYNNQQRAVQFNPYLDYYRRRYAITNLAIAAALSQKADRTEEENQQFSQLVQQAIREGRASAELDPSDSNNWLVLSQVYRSLIGVAEGADQWAVTSYVETINTNPQDPTLRVELGGILYGAQNYEEASRLFQQAINLKPDYANAYYNLANSLKQAGQLDNAKAAYQQVLLLVPADSENYVVAAKELEELEKAITEQAAQAKKTDTTTGTGTKTTPSITSQNTDEAPEDTVGQPSDQPLVVEPKPSTSSAAPSQSLLNSDL